MKQTLLILTCIAIFALGSPAQAPGSSAKPSAKDDIYKTLVAKLKGGDTSIDFKALRVASADSDEADAGDVDRDLRQKAFTAYGSKNYKEAIKAGEAALKTGYLDMDTHLMMALASEGAGDAKKHDFHKAVYLGLVNSILNGADGRSAKTAYVVVRVSEEYAVLRALGLNRGSQALQREDGHTFDVLTATDPKTNETLKIYFNIDIVWAGYNKVFKD